jgi:hypothetical protein
MNRETRRRVFDRHFSTKGGQNCGLGLSIAADIVRRHGGQIYLESEAGKGSTFRVLFPDPRAGAHQSAAGEEPLHLRVLLVEDEPAIREVIGQVLEAAGYVVRLAEDGDAALGMLDQGFDLVLTDLSLPGADGSEVAEAARRLNRETKIILMTGWEEGRGRACAEVDLVLTKPIRSPDLLRAVRQVWGDG